MACYMYITVAIVGKLNIIRMFRCQTTMREDSEHARSPRHFWMQRCNKMLERIAPLPPILSCTSHVIYIYTENGIIIYAHIRKQHVSVLH